MSKNNSLDNMLGERTHRGPLAWMIGNSVASNLLMFAFLVGGAVMMSNVKQEVFPESTLDIIQVSIPYPGANPQEVEHSIVLAVEESLQDINGLDDIRSSAREGYASINIELQNDTDPVIALQDIQQAVDGITSFPEDIETPQTTMLQHETRGVSLAIYGDVEKKSLRAIAERVRFDLLQDPDIALVEITNKEAIELAVTIPQDTLRSYGLTIQDVASRIRANALELSGGGVKTDGGEILLRLDERRDSDFDFASTPIITVENGNSILLGDIATLTDTFADTDQESFYNGKTAMIVEIFRVGDQTPIEVADAVFTSLDELNKSMPPGVHIAVLEDRSDMFRQRMELLTRNGYIGLALVLILLALFLEARLAFWVMMGIPISFMGVFLLMPMFGLSINLVTMFAFLVALGIVVDDAIIVGENIYEHQQRGTPFMEAAILGVREVAMPVVFSILTNVIAFSPLFFIPGFLGKIFLNIPAIVILAFLISLIECLFILPAHLAHQNPKSHRMFSAPHRWQQAFSQWFSDMVRRVYKPILIFVIRFRAISITIGIVLLMLTFGFVASKRIGFNLFPRIESDIATVTAVLPHGTAIKNTQAVRDRLLAAAQKIIHDGDGKGRHGDDIAIGIYTRIKNGGNVCSMNVYMPDPDTRALSTTEFVKRWREETGHIIGLESLLFEFDRGGPGGGAGITIELNHTNMGELEKAAASLASTLASYNGVADINDGFEIGKRQFDFTLRDQANSLGFTSFSIARQIRDAFYGSEALRQQRGRNEMRVQVRLPENERETEADLLNFMPRNPSGQFIPLPELVHVTQGHAYTVINRRNGKRTVEVTANVRPSSEAGRIAEEIEEVAIPLLLQKHSGLSYRFGGKQAEKLNSMKSLISGFAIAMLGVYALLAIPFRSYIQPVIVMFSIPFGAIGAVFGHVFMGYNLSVISVMGLIALSGVIVNDSLILIDYANNLRRKGLSPYDAIIEAGIRRFRPIMLTTMTTFFGLTPMILETSLQARFMIPMAISLGFGILFATMIALLLVPSLYLFIEDIRKLFGFKDPHAQE